MWESGSPVCSRMAFSAWVAWLGAALILGAGGCGPKFPNKEAQCPAESIAGEGYEFESMALGPGNTDRLFVCLTFSGGGTRAAALAYGVLEGLRGTAIPPLPGDGRPRCLLDEVDIVSSVSGGSFTALALGRWGDELFSSPFADRFLYHNVTADLVTRIIVQNLLILPIIFPDRIHIAADYMNERVFDHMTYAGLRQQRPFIVVNATSMAGHRFQFTQDDFDLLGSDLDSVPLGHAAMASSAFPLLLSPMRLRYYRNDLSTYALRQVLTDDDSELSTPRRRQWARQVVVPDAPDYGLDADEHRFVYLLDGGVCDNLGLEYVIDAYRYGPIQRRLAASADPNQRIEHLVVIVVNATPELPEEIEDRKIAPGLFDMASRSAAIGVNSHTRTSLEFARCLLEPDQIHRPGEGAQASLSTESAEMTRAWQGHLIEINLQHLQDPDRRQRLARLPTDFHLHKDEVRDLIAAGRELLTTHSGFVKLQAALAR